jgi:hypothetical protein
VPYSGDLGYWLAQPSPLDQLTAASSENRIERLAGIADESRPVTAEGVGYEQLRVKSRRFASGELQDPSGFANQRESVSQLRQ